MQHSPSQDADRRLQPTLRIDRNMDHVACNTAYWMLDAIRNTHSAEQHARLLPLELYVDIHLLVTQSLFTYSSLLMRTRCRRGAP
jgi:hypothetical protein